MRKIFILTIFILLFLPNTQLATGRVSLGFLYNSSDSLDLVERTQGGINEVAPTYFTLDSRGNLVISSMNETFIEEVKQENVKVTPFLSNNWSRSKGRSALKNRENLTNQIVQAIENYHLDGINIDIENLTSDDKDNFSDFVRLLKEKLPEGKELTVSVAANPYGLDTGWQGSYDYMALGEVADYLFVMTYDEHSYGGAAGEVASATFVEQSIQYALQQVDKSKIVIGIPFYGRFWRTESDVGGEAIVIGDVARIISRFHAKVSYETMEQTAYASFTVPEGSTTKVNGNVLLAGNYKMWYENEESIKYKLYLVNKYNLRGAGVWALGQESKEVWNYYADALNEAFVEEETTNMYENYSGMNAIVSKWKIQLTIEKLTSIIEKKDITKRLGQKAIVEIPPKTQEVVPLEEKEERIIDTGNIKKVSIVLNKKEAWKRQKKMNS